MTITGELTEDRSKELTEAVIRALQGAKHLILDIEDVTSLDISCLMLLCSAYSITTALNKRMTLAGACPYAVRSLIEADFCRLRGCVQSASECLFLDRLHG